MSVRESLSIWHSVPG